MWFRHRYNSLQTVRIPNNESSSCGANSTVVTNIMFAVMGGNQLQNKARKKVSHRQPCKRNVMHEHPDSSDVLQSTLKDDQATSSHLVMCVPLGNR